MIRIGEDVCPRCSGRLSYFDKPSRIVRGRYGKVRYEKIRRLICVKCGSVHRELPLYLLPYKHYERQIIEGFVCQQLSIFDLEFEDYPCESTIRTWKRIFKS